MPNYPHIHRRTFARESIHKKLRFGVNLSLRATRKSSKIISHGNGSSGPARCGSESLLADRLIRQGVSGPGVVWTRKPSGGPVHAARGLRTRRRVDQKAFRRTGSYGKGSSNPASCGPGSLQADRFGRRQDVFARTRCKDSASEHLAPPFYCARPTKNSRRPRLKPRCRPISSMRILTVTVTDSMIGS